MTLDLAELRRLHKAATPGEWVNAEVNGFTIENGDGHVVAEYITEPDYRFITAAHTHLPAILDRLEAAEAKVARVEEMAQALTREAAHWRSGARTTGPRLLRKERENAALLIEGITDAFRRALQGADDA